MTNEQIDGLAQFFANIYDRWQDEQQYEDFAEYRKAFASKLPTTAELKKLTPRPFRASVVAEGKTYVFNATRRDVTVKLYNGAVT